MFWNFENKFKNLKISLIFFWMTWSWREENKLDVTDVPALLPCVILRQQVSDNSKCFRRSDESTNDSKLIWLDVCSLIWQMLVGSVVQKSSKLHNRIFQIDLLNDRWLSQGVEKVYFQIKYSEGHHLVQREGIPCWNFQSIFKKEGKSKHLAHINHYKCKYLRYFSSNR